MAKSKSTSKVGGISSEAVVEATGKTWTQWLSLLDKAGAKKMSHKEIVAVVGGRYGVGPWWRQMVTVGYEQARGLREKHEKPGGFEIGKSRTIAVSVSSVFGAWTTAAFRRLWLPDGKVAIRKATTNKSLRVRWGDGATSLDVNLYSHGAAKCRITVQHAKLPSAKEAAKMKTYWGKNLERLKGLLES